MEDDDPRRSGMKGVPAMGRPIALMVHRVHGVHAVVVVCDAVANGARASQTTNGLVAAAPPAPEHFKHGTRVAVEVLCVRPKALPVAAVSLAVLGSQI